MKLKRLFKVLILILTPFAAIFGAILLLGVIDQPEFIEWDDPWRTQRQAVTGKSYMAVAGTPWATEAAVEVLESGGNAFDAAVAALLVLNVTFGEAASFPCIAPMLIYDARQDQVRSYVGVGTAPAAATIERFQARGFTVVPKLDVYSQLLPASPDVIVELLSKYGTKTFQELSMPAIRIAREGFPLHRTSLRNLDFNLFERLGFTFILPYNSKVYIQSRWWRPLRHKQRFTRPELANTLEAMGEAETRARQGGGDRKAGLLAVRDYFYKGPIADKILAMHKRENGLFTREDLANYKGYWEEPLRGEFRGFEIRTNGTWTQGIVVPLALQILEGLDLKSMGHNSEEYVHTVAQAIELAMADREVFVGDPAFVKVPLKNLLSPEYAALRRGLLGKEAFGKTPPAGNPVGMKAIGAGPSVGPGVVSLYDKNIGRDTSYLSIVDRAGNAVSMTPSDFPNSPMVDGTGLTLGIRMTQFRLDKKHPSSLAPGKRPRVTPHALMIFKNKKLYMSLGTPGAEMQTQALVQVLLNHMVFGMDIQTAIEQPRFRSLNWPDSFSPHSYSPGVLELEATLYGQIGDGLRARGYKLERFEDLDNHFSAVGAVLRDKGLLYGGADPREETTAIGL